MGDKGEGGVKFSKNGWSHIGTAPYYINWVSHCFFHSKKDQVTQNWILEKNMWCSKLWYSYFIKGLPEVFFFVFGIFSKNNQQIGTKRAHWFFEKDQDAIFFKFSPLTSNSEYNFVSEIQLTNQFIQTRTTKQIITRGAARQNPSIYYQGPNSISKGIRGQQKSYFF